MKRFTVIALAVLVAFSCLISCSNESATVESQLVSVSFAPAQSRSLQEIKPDFVGVNHESLIWYYKASKTTDSNFQTGATNTWKIIGEDGKLTNTVIFSLGIWDISLRATLSDGTVLYEGSKSGIAIDNPNGINTIQINVYASVLGQEGFLILDNVYILEQNGIDKVAPNILVISASGEESGTSYSLIDNGDGTVDSHSISLQPGSYDVAVGYVNGTIVNAGEIKTVQIYSGRTTTVTGYIDELTSEVEFAPVADTGVATPTSVISEESTTTFTVVNVTPSGEASRNTEAVFEAGALSADGDYKLSTSVSNEIEKGNFSITSPANPVASLDLSLTNGTEVVSTFGDNKKVTITTYIAKGLTNVSVEGPEEAVVESVFYNTADGELIFTTNHFSEYIVKTTDNFVLYNSTKKKVYVGLAAAVNDVSSGDCLKLIKDFDLNERVTIASDKIVTLDLCGHTITYKGTSETESSTDRDRPIRIEGELIINNGEQNSREESNGGITVANKYVYGIFDVRQNGKLTINGGYYCDNGENGGSIIRGRKDSYVLINNGSFVSSMYDAAVNDEGITIINDGYFYTNSRSDTYTPDGNYPAYSYCIRNSSFTEGAVPYLEINGGTVIGIQGAIAVSAGSAKISNVNAIARDLDGDSDSKSFYALYVAGEHADDECVINGGKFTADKYALYVGNNNTNGDGGINANAAVVVNGGTFKSHKYNSDINVDSPLGAMIINGGQYSHNTVYDKESKNDISINDFCADGYVISAEATEGYYEIVEAVARIDDEYYETLVAAFAAVPKDSTKTITLLKDSVGGGVKVISSRQINVTVDFAGHTYTCADPAVGSSGTETQGFHLERGNTFTFKNGKLEVADSVSNTKMLFQVYADLTLENMTVDGTNLIGDAIVLSLNCGEVNIIGTTSITSKSNGYAVDASWWPSHYPEGATVNVNTSGTVEGNISLGAFGNYKSITTPSATKLKIANVNHEGSIVKVDGASWGETYSTGLAEDALAELFAGMCEITGGTFSSDPSAYVDTENYEVTLNESTWSVTAK